MNLVAHLVLAQCPHHQELIVRVILDQQDFDFAVAHTPT
jgi:hypothetical protein